MRATPIKLRAYGGHAIQILGPIQVRISVKTGQPAQTLPILVVQGNGLNLLGRDVLMKLQLDWREIHRVNTRLEQYSTSTRRSSQSVSGRTGDNQQLFRFDPSVRPHFSKARTVPYALRHLVVQQLDTMEKEGERH